MAVAAADFSCEDGLAQQPIGKSELSRRKCYVVGSLIVAFGASLMVGFFVLGPLTKVATPDAEATHAGHVQKFTSMLPAVRHAASVGSNIQGSAGSAILAAGGRSMNPVVKEASRLFSQCQRNPAPQMALPLGLDLTGKVAFVAGVADSNGFGWAICKALAEAGATITVGTWPPVLGIFEKALKSGKLDKDMILSDGSKMKIEKIYPLDATFDFPADVPANVLENKRYAGLEGYTISECASSVAADYDKIDILVHSLANGPEVTKPLMETTRGGYLAASSASAYSLVSLVQNFAPNMNPGGSVLSLTYAASEKVIPGYGGGMSSAKAQLESDTRVLAYEAGQKYQIRVNTISAGPLKSRAAMAISDKKGPKAFIEVAIDYAKCNAPLQRDLASDDVGQTAAFLCSPMAGGVTGSTLYVDNGLHAMGMVQTGFDQVRD